MIIRLEMTTRIDLGDGAPPFDVDTSHVISATDDDAVEPLIDIVRMQIIAVRKRHAEAVKAAT